MIGRDVPSTAATVWTLAGVTLQRLARGKAVWIGGLIAALQIVYAVIVRDHRELTAPDDLFESSMPILALLPAMFVGASVGEEIDERTSTYLWSRPIARWAVLAGKLCALAPIVIALIVGGWVAATVITHGALPSGGSCLALAAGAAATSVIAAAIATVMPRHGMALTVGYMLVDIFIGVMPFSLNALSITHQTTELAGLRGEPAAIAAPLIAMAAVSALWAAVGWLRIRRLEV